VASVIYFLTSKIAINMRNSCVRDTCIHFCKTFNWQYLLTSNVTGRYRGPRSFGLITERRHGMYLCVSSVICLPCLLDIPDLCAPRIFHRRVWYHVFTQGCAHTMRIVDVWATPSP